MRTKIIFLLLSLSIVVSACSQEAPKVNETEKPVVSEDFVLVNGGTFVNAKTNFYEESVTISSFYIGKYEVTQKEWMEVMGDNPSIFVGDHMPAEMVSWYDVIEYCNQRSKQEGLKPYYNIDKNKIDPENKSEFDPVKWKVTINKDANGYRLPTEAEWEYAASGGQLSESYLYSGSDIADDVAWNWKNSGNKYLEGDWSWPAIESNRNHTKAVGSKEPNELGLYDMSGNVREWVWDWHEDEEGVSGLYRIVKGGGWMGDVTNNEVAFRGKFEASGYGPDQGFRLARNE